MSEIVDPKASDRRRTWGLFFLAGGGVAMTGLSAALSWSFVFGPWPAETALVRLEWLGWALIGKDILAGIAITGFAGLIVKRTLRLSKDGIELTDQAGNG